MMISIFHFFSDLLEKRQSFKTIAKLESFPFDEKMLSCRNKGVFPDLAIKLHKDGNFTYGGELIELKDAQSYGISSFNSTLPQGQKPLSFLSSGTREQMERNGDDLNLSERRDVYYLVRGRKKNFVKVCLVHGSFFETVPSREAIKKSFRQVLEESSQEENIKLSEQEKEKVLNVLSRQNYFSQSRKVAKASISLRFRIMAEARPEGNILNTKIYPTILDNSINLVMPHHDARQGEQVLQNIKSFIPSHQLEFLKHFIIHHPFNGDFIVFQGQIPNT